MSHFCDSREVEYSDRHALFVLLPDMLKLSGTNPGNCCEESGALFTSGARLGSRPHISADTGRVAFACCRDTSGC